MIIDSVYLLLPDGRCIFSKTYKGSDFDPHLLGGLLNAFNIASQQWLKDGVRKFISEEGMNFIIKDFVSFLVVISGILNNEEEIILEKIGLKFLSKFGNKIEKWQQGNVGILKSFESDLDRILEFTSQPEGKKEDNFIKTLDEPYLDSLTIITLPNELQKSALALLALKTCTITELSQETKRKPDDEIKAVEKLVALGYVLKKKSNNNKIIYYLP